VVGRKRRKKRLELARSELEKSLKPLPVGTPVALPIPEITRLMSANPRIWQEITEQDGPLPAGSEYEVRFKKNKLPPLSSFGSAWLADAEGMPQTKRILIKINP